MPLPQATPANARTAPSSGRDALPAESAPASSCAAKTAMDDRTATGTADAASTVPTAASTSTHVTPPALTVAEPPDTGISQVFPAGQARDGSGKLLAALSAAAKTRRAPLLQHRTEHKESGPKMSEHAPVSAQVLTTFQAMPVNPGTEYGRTDNLSLQLLQEPANSAREASVAGTASFSIPEADAAAEDLTVIGEPEQADGPSIPTPAPQAVAGVQQATSGSLADAGSSSSAAAIRTSKPHAEAARGARRSNQPLKQVAANAPPPARPETPPTSVAPNSLPASPLGVEDAFNRQQNAISLNRQPDHQSAASPANGDTTPRSTTGAATTSSGPAAPAGPPAGVWEPALAAPPAATAPGGSTAASLAFSARLTPLFSRAGGSTAADVQTESVNAVPVRALEAQGSHLCAPRTPTAAIALPRDGATVPLPPPAPDNAGAGSEADSEETRTPGKPSLVRVAHGLPDVDHGSRETLLSDEAASTPAASGNGDSPSAKASDAAWPASQPAAQTSKGVPTPAPDKRDQTPVAKTADVPSDRGSQVAVPSNSVQRITGGAASARQASASPDTKAPAPGQPVAEGQLRPAGAARGIQLQMNAGDKHVEIRVTDRAGEVKVDVHTPDSRLAGALRADLPELAARIEQTGYHAETWQPVSSTSPDRWRPAESGAASQNMQDDSQRQGGQQQNDGRRQNSEDGEQGSPRKQDRKDFKWLFNSIR